MIEALRADSATTGFVDGLEIDAEAGQITIQGAVDDIVDEEAIIAVVESVSGVTSVDSKLVIAALDSVDARLEPLG